jgi:molybdopterin/thiamine biosynthesis adenylyltransferase
MAARLRMTKHHLGELRRLVFEAAPRESAAFALAGVSRHAAGVDVLVHRVIAIPQDCYVVREQYRLDVAPRAINGMASLCEAAGLGLVYCHSHPGDIDYSLADDLGERRLTEFFRGVLPPAAPIASLLLCPNTTYGRLWQDALHDPLPLDEVVIVGQELERIHLQDPPRAPEQGDLESYDRQLRLWGTAGQQLVASTKVGIVGVGGTGSPAAEQLVRLGVQDLTIVDKDYFEDSNLTRVYGAFHRHTAACLQPGTSAAKKVDLIADHLRAIRPGVAVRPLHGKVHASSIAHELRDRDIVFLCTDDQWGRAVVNCLAYQYLIPAFNLGVQIARLPDRSLHGAGVVDVLRPGLPCLQCKNSIDPDRVAAESLPPQERRRRQDAGYVHGLLEHAPMVISLTTTVAGLAVTEFLHCVTGFLGTRPEIQRLNYDPINASCRSGRTTPAENCHCQRFAGYGDLRPIDGLLQDR